ncbi:hypothetical protein [Streptosporangium roseum]|uniref:Uncharacterized protein n=1 Tax=Streptosporangium roseum (strain ATCC 12428 / DSM 43021 / JCM 3005 / KCTC 9067 / NCIMB 10171 / NRRL 2505 / NI 9100) TaxID=479432 RepID=D2BFW0_STRRD|nr:hypothetical protein [Streptosporangium roseum]ACZ92012.1 hypothetical protein Sros_9394 [Streptosporangium roseum DSM 43021]
MSTRTDDLGTQMIAFENAEIIASHEAFENHVHNAQRMARTLALMLVQDGEIVSTWLRHRKPKKGKRVPLLERVSLSRRTRAHSRNAADALLEAVSSLQKMTGVHAEYVRTEKASVRDDPPHK